MQVEKSILELILPEGALEYFDVLEGRMDENNFYIILEEKNNPPVAEENKNKKIISKGFKDITITDFPIRGRRTLLTFKRRYWQIEGQKEYLKRDIKLSFPGTQLAKEFADFLKEKSRNAPDVAEFYRGYALPPDQGI